MKADRLVPFQAARDYAETLGAFLGERGGVWQLGTNKRLGYVAIVNGRVSKHAILTACEKLTTTKGE